MRTTRSEPETTPGAGKASFYYGNEKEHEDKRKMLDEERKNEYNQFIKEVKECVRHSTSEEDSQNIYSYDMHNFIQMFLKQRYNITMKPPKILEWKLSFVT